MGGKQTNLYKTKNFFGINKYRYLNNYKQTKFLTTKAIKQQHVIFFVSEYISKLEKWRTERRN